MTNGSTIESKRLKPETPPDYDEYHIAFSFRHMAQVRDFSLSSCSKNEKASVADKLYMLGQTTWKQIHREPKEKLGCEMIPVSQLKAKLPSCIEEITKVMVFRFSEKGRLAGDRERDIFNIIFVAPNHDLY
ncbi:hypothetical protein [Candidatus Magnetominusculus xianensis]|uniref:Uncharacterized protein n=1 Tax=Candidatus Magnetominusculus xianensis TaxID=1748249 RepID=A0ABR5SE14_9BACT|nr:hypothetical protein [Candidatus Magnetominusculus xianensis]KWT79709.1 hypothetical protein ASN18_2682 [Candidatus Magnetominusculus xianensis]MBF0404750.1 hypothetical protein [Nitrospirota bacterium]